MARRNTQAAPVAAQEAAPFVITNVPAVSASLAALAAATLAVSDHKEAGAENVKERKQRNGAAQWAFAVALDGVSIAEREQAAGTWGRAFAEAAGITGKSVDSYAHKARTVAVRLSEVLAVPADKRDTRTPFAVITAKEKASDKAKASRVSTARITGEAARSLGVDGDKLADMLAGDHGPAMQLAAEKAMQRASVVLQSPALQAAREFVAAMLAEQDGEARAASLAVIAKAFAFNG